MHRQGMFMLRYVCYVCYEECYEANLVGVCYSLKTLTLTLKDKELHLTKTKGRLAIG